jgi:hypothetical protein
MILGLPRASHSYQYASPQITAAALTTNLANFIHSIKLDLHKLNQAKKGKNNTGLQFINFLFLSVTLAN